MSAAATLCHGSRAWALARPLLPGVVALAATDPSAPQPPALPQERAALTGARPARLREFDAGRTAARRAMVQLGVAPAAVLHGDDRAPIWPEGLVGTITHGAGACLAAQAYRRDIQALGLDLEEATTLEPDLFETICTGAELNHLAALPPDQRGLRAKLIFSAKEAAYKAQYPLSRTLFDFQTLEISLDAGNPGQFSAHFLRAIAPFPAGSLLSGRYAIGGGWIVTAVAIAA